MATSIEELTTLRATVEADRVRASGLDAAKLEQYWNTKRDAEKAELEAEKARLERALASGDDVVGGSNQQKQMTPDEIKALLDAAGVAMGGGAAQGGEGTSNRMATQSQPTQQAKSAPKNEEA